MIFETTSSAGSRRRSSVPLTKPIRSFLTSSSSLANSSGQSIAGTEPVRSSKVNLAIRVSPERLFWTFRTCTLAIIPPRITSVFSATPARSATWCVASAWSKPAWRVRGWLDM